MDITDRQPDLEAVKVPEASTKESPKAGAGTTRRAANPLDLLKDLRVGQKLALIAASLMIPLAVLLFFVISDVNEELAFFQSAADGSEYLTGLADIIDVLPAHRGLTNVLLNGNETVRDDVLALRARIDAEFAEIQALNDIYGEAFDTTGIVTQMTEDWLALEAALEAGTISAPEAFAAHTTILGEHLELMQTVTHNSGLSLDPELETNLLISAVSLQLPEIAEDLGVLRGLGAGLLQRGSATRVDREALAIEIGRIEVLFEQLNFSLEEALAISPEMQAELGELDVTAREAAESAVLLAEREIIEAETLTFDPLTYFDTLTAAIANQLELFHTGLEYADNSVHEQLATLQQNRLATIATIATLLVVAVLLVFWVARQIVRPVTDLASVAERVGHGDLSQFAQVQTRDEIGLLAGTFNQAIVEMREAAERNELELARGREMQRNISSFLDIAMDIADGDFTKRGQVSEDVLGNVVDAINLMVEELTFLLQDVQGAALSVTEGSSEMAGITDEITQNATLQAEEARKATDDVQQVTHSIREMAENAEESAQAASRTLQASQQGQQALDNTLHGMQNIRREVQSISKRIKGLGDRSLEISEIVETISRISSQTNLLALNAAIEASGAGEAGSRFAVVAGEVRRLAEDSKLATERIETLIRAVQNEVQEVIVSVEDGTREVETGYRVTTEAGERLKEIGDIATRSAALAQLISQATQGQVRNVEEVGSSVSTIAGISERSQASVVRGREAARKLQELAEALTGNLARFRLN